MDLVTPPVEGQVAIALFDFEGQRDEELGFKEGDSVVVLKADPSKKWWLVQASDTLRTGCVLPLRLV